MSRKNPSKKPIKKEERLDETLRLLHAIDQRQTDKKRNVALNEQRRKANLQDPKTMREIERIRARNEAQGRVFLLRPGIEERRHFGDEKSHVEVKVNSSKAMEPFSADSFFAFGHSKIPLPAAKPNAAKRKPLQRRLR